MTAAVAAIAQWRHVTGTCDVVSLPAPPGLGNTGWVTARSPAFTKTTQKRLRRINLLTSLPPVVFAAVVLLATDAHTWWHLVVLAPGVAFERWTADDLARVALPCTIVGAVVWPLGVLLTGSPNAYWASARSGLSPSARYDAGPWQRSGCSATSPPSARCGSWSIRTTSAAS